VHQSTPFSRACRGDGTDGAATTRYQKKIHAEHRPIGRNNPAPDPVTDELDRTVGQQGQVVLAASW
jgi:hypothetical protein